jgi:hypothetical protein
MVVILLLVSRVEALAGFNETLDGLYTGLTKAIQGSIKDNFGLVSRSATQLLGSMATAWVVIYGINCYIKGNSINRDFIAKMALFIILTALLSFNTFDKYVIT